MDVQENTVETVGYVVLLVYEVVEKFIDFPSVRYEIETSSSIQVINKGPSAENRYATAYSSDGISNCGLLVVRTPLSSGHTYQIQ